MYAIVNKSILPIYTAPSKESVVIDEILLGMKVEVLWEDSNDFYYIKTFYEYKGYVEKDFLILDVEKVKSWCTKKKYMVVNEFSDILSNTFYDSKILITLVRGSRVLKGSNETKTRIKIELPDGKEGWIRREFIREIQNVKDRDKLEVREEIVENALKYLGKQFRWGGKTPLGLDCSGFSSMIYLLSNLIIWRDSDFRDDNLIQITREELKKGDLIYVNEKEFMAIYIGNNKFITASSVNASVIIRSLNNSDEDYYGIFLENNVIFACHKLLRGE